MNLRLIPINNQAKYNSNLTFRAVKYEPATMGKIKGYCLKNKGTLEKLKNFEQSKFFNGDKALTAIVSLATGFLPSLVSFFGKETFNVHVVDTQKNPAQNVIFNIRDGNIRREDNPFKDVEEYAQELINVNEHFANVNIANEEDYIPGLAENDDDNS